MQRALLWLMCSVFVLTAGACSAGSNVGHVVDYAAKLYRAPTGWIVAVPRGWHMTRFSESKMGIRSAGVQISNVRLPAPRLVPGYPIQVSDRVLPAKGVGLIIATDTESGLSHGIVATPPVPEPTRWLKGSALAGIPCMEAQWFRVNGRVFIANAKVGPQARNVDLTALTWIIESLRVP